MIQKVTNSELGESTRAFTDSELAWFHAGDHGHLQEKRADFARRNEKVAQVLFVVVSLVALALASPMTLSAM